jgi:hypothetical protein
VTIDDQMVAAEQYEALWVGLMPDDDAPDEDQFLLWAGQYSEELVARGINRVARKYRKLRDTSEPMSVNDAIRYASSVMKNEALGIRQHPNGAAQKATQLPQEEVSATMQ